MNFNQLINEIRKLNPDVEIRIGNPQFDSLASNRIFSSVPMDKLKLPEGFYANDKNGITNKHNTETGLYSSLSVDSIQSMAVGLTLPNVDVSKSLETTDVREIAIALQRLNPNVQIRLGNPAYDSMASERIYCSVPMNELALPQPFYYNDKNGITNKHESQSGMYASISVEDISKANPNILMKTGYNLQEELSKSYELDVKRSGPKQAQEHAGSYTYDSNLKAPRVDNPTPELQRESIPQPLQVDPAQQLVNMAQEQRKFTILQRERAMNEHSKGKTRAAIAAGLCILGACTAIHFSGADINTVLQNELNAVYSWEALGQYFKDLGPLTTMLAAGAGAFVAKYFKHSKKFNDARNQFIDMNDSLSNDLGMGGNENAKSR